MTKQEIYSTDYIKRHKLGENLRNVEENIDRVNAEIIIKIDKITYIEKGNFDNE